MAKFNEKSQGTKTLNRAGGQAYKQTPELEMVSILLTSFANDQFYRTANQTFDVLKDLIKRCNKKFVAQSAIYARTQFGMRSITHVTASELAKYIGGEEWARDFYEKVIHRVDDMTEILSYHTAHNGKVSNAMKEGLARAFAKFDAYQLAKYKGEGKGFKLVDVVNITHPLSVPEVWTKGETKQAIEALIKGELKSTDTWESKLTKAGQNAKDEDEKLELKKEAWTELINSRKLGYFALLRNLRNILTQAPNAVDKALEMLTDERLIKKSLVMPFRYLTAIQEMKLVNNSRKVLQALNKAINISLANVPTFEGKTLIALDLSGSMDGKPIEIGSVFASALYKSNDADLLVFGNDAQYKMPNPDDSLLTIASELIANLGGTNFHSIFERANRKYDRVIILSDMQGWMYSGWGSKPIASSYNKWKQVTGSDPYIYSFDLQGYGDMQFPERNVFCIAGFSDKVFDIMKLLETDKQALVNEIKRVEL